jgi:hypothetical protein
MCKKIIKKIPGMKFLAKLYGSKSIQDKRRFLLDTLPKDSRGVEIGVHIGDFSRKILDVVRPAELYLVDPWEYQQSDTYMGALYGGGAKNGQIEMDERYKNVCKRFGHEIQKGIVKIKREYSSNVLMTFPDNYLDWVYIDGNHLYEYVKNDLELSLQKVCVGGYITGDDYREGGWWNGGVKKAVDEFVSLKFVKITVIQNSQFILQKI